MQTLRHRFRSTGPERQVSHLDANTTSDDRVDVIRRTGKRTGVEVADALEGIWMTGVL